MSHLIEVYLRYYVLGNGAIVTIACDLFHLDPDFVLTVLVEHPDEVQVADIHNTGCTERLAVSDGESLTFLARREGQIVACAVYEVDRELTEVGLLLAPRAVANLLLDQGEVEREAGLHSVAKEVC
ncbi:MAG TPA: hypothetical protein VFA41_17135 [Ktedonobacteraceae bacterium]|jgi:hypothetical protein|nr:hypothetical protein [Ktedonobacteraceae bacterium]